MEGSEMNRLVMGVVVALLFVAVSPVAVKASGWTGNVNLKAGAKALDEDDWEPLEDQNEIGADIDFRMVDWPVSVTVALYGSAQKKEISGMDVEGKTGELRIGIKKIWEPDPSMRPFVGGGIAFISAENEWVNEYLSPLQLKVSDDDQGTGLWVSGGVFWTIKECFNLGFELGLSSVDVTLFNQEKKAGGAHAALLLGYHW
jgi:hypothetical protein